LYQSARLLGDHKKVLPLHYNVYLAKVGCKKREAANVESIFSGAGKFTNTASKDSAAQNSQGNPVKPCLELH
jgi:hypothetical protein